MRIDELSELTGVSARNIRAYIEQKLLPPPIGKTRGAVYTEMHYRDLQRIQALRMAGWTLEDIRAEVGGVRMINAQVVSSTHPPAVVEHRFRVAPGVSLVLEFDSASVDPGQIPALLLKIKALVDEVRL